MTAAACHLPDRAEFFVAVDPGLAKVGGSGWAYFQRRVLVAAGVLRNHRTWVELGTRVRGQDALLEAVLLTCHPNTLVVSEWMTQRYGSWAKKIPPQDLIDLNALTGKLGDYYVTPTQWKMAIPREVEISRTRCALTPAETKVMDEACEKLPKSIHKEVSSAVGIGLSVSGRAHRKCGWPA